MTQDSRRAAGRDLGARLFRFAIISDTHVNHEERDSSSPWPSNKLANRRSRYAFARASRLDPAFVVHLGDMVHPVPSQQSYEEAARAFRALASVLRCPLHLTPGNHDIGDKPVSWMPAGAITEGNIEKYRRQFGKDFYAFRAEGCLFVVLNASLMNSGLPAEEEQRSWLESVLDRGASARVFLFVHYPPYVSAPEEPGGYDNIDEPARSWLLGLVRKYAPEALFSGHVHNFWYDVCGTTEMYVVPAISFVRQDYSELYKVEPGPENGRDDAAKLGFVIVDVHERGHVAKVERSYGAELAPGEEISAEARLEAIHSKTNRLTRVGVDLRHPWAEIVEIAPSGGVDEFGRKFARNDYPLLALWEMGIRTARVPLQDLATARTRRRMELLDAIGHEFIVYTYDLPAEADWEVLAEFRHLVAALEVVTPWPLSADRCARLDRLRRDLGVPVFLSRLRPHESGRNGQRFAHAIRHGFLLDEADELASSGAQHLADGFVFRVAREDPVAAAVMRADEWAGRHRSQAMLAVRLAAEDPAERRNDDAANADLVAEAVFSGLASENVTVVLDSFVDVDRSYFARTGLVDRRYNPRPAGAVTKHLHAWFGARQGVAGALIPRGGAAAVALVSPGELEILVLPKGGPVAIGRLMADTGRLGAEGDGRAVDLVRGTIRELVWTAAPDGEARAVRLDREIVARNPVLLSLRARATS